MLHLLSQWGPTGIYVAFIQAFGLSLPSVGTHLFFQCIFCIFHSAGMAWLSHQTVSVGHERNEQPKVSLELRGGFYAA
jgi:hypothetical protein